MSYNLSFRVIGEPLTERRGPPPPLHRSGDRGGDARNKESHPDADPDPDTPRVSCVLGETRDEDAVVEDDPNGEADDSEEAEGARRDLEVSGEAAVQSEGLEDREGVLVYEDGDHDSGGPNRNQVDECFKHLHLEYAA